MSSIITFVSLLACFRPRADDIEAQLAGAKEADADDVADLLPQMARLEGRPLRSKFLFNWGLYFMPWLWYPGLRCIWRSKVSIEPWMWALTVDERTRIFKHQRAEEMEYALACALALWIFIIAVVLTYAFQSILSLF